MTIRLLSLLLLALCCLTGGNAQPRVFPGYSADEVRQRIDRIGPSPVEGLWQFTGQGATVAIERASEPADPNSLPASFNIIMVESPDKSIRKGTLIGTASPTALATCFDCHLFNDTDKPDGKKRRFTMRLNDGGHISFLKVKTGVTVSLRRWMPYLFRMTVIRRNERDDQLDGCIRVYPVDPSTFNTPRYL